MHQWHITVFARHVFFFYVAPISSNAEWMIFVIKQSVLRLSYSSGWLHLHIVKYAFPISNSNSKSKCAFKKEDPTLKKECIYHSRNKKKIWTEIEMTLTSNTDCLNLNYFLMKMWRWCAFIDISSKYRLDFSCS